VADRQSPEAPFGPDPTAPWVPSSNEWFDDSGPTVGELAAAERLQRGEPTYPPTEHASEAQRERTPAEIIADAVRPAEPAPARETERWSQPAYTPAPEPARPIDARYRPAEDGGYASLQIASAPEPMLANPPARDPDPAPEPAPAPPAVEEPPRPRRSGWWQRRFSGE
jgi:ribonuclease E